MKREVLLQRLINGHLRNVRFTDFVDLVEAFGFHLVHVKGSHHIYKHLEVEEALNLQPVRGEAKPYQIRQFIAVMELYNLSLEERD